MTDESPSPVAVALNHVDGLTSTQRLAAAYLFDVGESTVPDAIEATGISTQTVYNAFSELSETELVQETEGPDNGERGQNPKLYVATLPADAQFEESERELKDRVVHLLAEKHYRKRVSSTRAKHVANALGVTASKAGRVLRRLRDDGVVEDVGDQGHTNNYRLVPPPSIAPYDAAEAEEVKA